MNARQDWKKEDRARRMELQEERLMRAFSAPMAVLPRAIAGQKTGEVGDFSRPRECGEGDPANFSEPEKALIAQALLTQDRELVNHFRRVGHPAFQ